MWRAVLTGGRGEPGLRGWLTEPGSLTARLQRNAALQVRVVRQGLAAPLAGGLAAPLAQVREVVLAADGRPVIFAHTVLPRSPRGRLSRWLAGLGSRSLGSLLFSYPGFVRSPIAFCRLDARHPLYRRAQAALGSPLPARVWARASWHGLGGQRVLVCEVFLPAISALTRP